jgi:hypothetical protein
VDKKQGFSVNTIRAPEYESLTSAVKNGARVFHGIKSKEVLDIITTQSPWVLHATGERSVRYISFSLWGNKPKYTIGAQRNIELARIHYPDWKVRFYLKDTSVGDLDFLAASEAEIKFIPAWLKDPMFARYLCADDPTCERVIFRDCDSRLSAREAAAVEEWITLKQVFSSLRDHPAHGRAANGGLCGIRGGKLNMTVAIQSYWAMHAGGYNGVDQDQNFLCRHLWPMVQHSVTQHDSHSAKHFPGSRPFPTKREGWRFCGEVVEINPDGSETFRAHDWPQLTDVSEEARKEAIVDAVFTPLI